MYWQVLKAINSTVFKTVLVFQKVLASQILKIRTKEYSVLTGRSENNLKLHGPLYHCSSVTSDWSDLDSTESPPYLGKEPNALIAGGD